MTSRPTTPADGERSTPQHNRATASTLPAWLDQAVLYAVDVPAFRDSDGDGIGDLMGVIDALDDLADLGVTVIWLLPFYPSPRQDNGYDVADHYDVDSRLGTLDDLRRLVHEARGREMRVMVDLVANHTSDRHPWFEAVLTDPDCSYRDYYVWRDSLDGVPEKEPVFPNFEKSVWTYTEMVGAWYLHHFYRFEPDLNIKHEVVREEIRNIIQFWLELGIDGFRLDAAPFLGDDLMDGTPDPHELLKTIRGWVTEVNPEACLLAEADLRFDDMGAYFGQSGAEEMDALFDFMLSRSVFLALAQETADAVVRCLTSSPVAPPSSIWVSFLRHADELSLSWLDEEEKRKVFDRFAPDEAMRVYGRGIRRRLAPLMGNDWDLVRFCCSLQFSLPGAPLIMYGDEIGLGENLVLPERAAVRTAMQWDAPGATPMRMLLPDITAREARSIPVDPVPLPEGAADHRAWLKGLVALRRSLLRDCRRTFELVETGNPHLLVHRYDPDPDPIVCIHNFSSEPQVVDLGNLGPAGCAVFGSGITEPRMIGLDAIELDGHGYIWIQVGEIERAAWPGTEGDSAMMTIGYHASHEQFTPADLLRWVRLAEEAGFGAAMCSDHFAPWSESQGQSAFAWSWLGAALEATSLSFGTVTAPGYRYHPAIVAQAAATLASMYPDRLWLALGSGEAMNERMTGLQWPIKAERQERLGECIEIIRALWAGETVTHHGRVTVEEAKLWTRPERPPLLVGAALSEKTAAWCASWADALITINAPRERLVAIIDAFQSHGGADKPLFLQSHVSWAPTEKEARAQAMEQWRTAVLPAPIGQDLRSPSQFDEIAQFIGESDVAGAVRISSDPGQHIAWLGEDRELGFSRVYLHNVGANQEAFIETFGSSVLPQLD